MRKLVKDPLDRQLDDPVAYCAECGGEIYAGEECYHIPFTDTYYHEDCIRKEGAGE